jgi:import receptor subunit TOM70
VLFRSGYWYYRSRKASTTTHKSLDDVEKQAALGQKVAVDVEAVPSTGEKQNGSATVVPAAAKPVEAEEDPFKLAQIYKNKGNKCFKEGKYADAINYYAQAIEVCPKTKVHDISTFHQNRAAAYEQLVRYFSLLLKIQYYLF